jgi:GNAT superfamily N-acetyltransferase
VDPHARVELRRAEIDDAPAIAPFHLACWHAAYSGLVPPDFLAELSQQDRVQRWRERLGRQGDETLVAVVGTVVVGLATVGPSGDRCPLPATELRSLYVDAGHHGTGIAQRLVDTSLADRPASLWVFQGNHRARAFYDKNGWRPTGECRVDPGTRIPELRLVRAGVC